MTNDMEKIEVCSHFFSKHFLVKIVNVFFVYIYIYFGSLGFPITVVGTELTSLHQVFSSFLNTLTRKKSSVPFIFHFIAFILDSSFSLVIFKYSNCDHGDKYWKYIWIYAKDWDKYRISLNIIEDILGIKIHNFFK